MASREEIDMLITGADRLARQRQEQRERYRQRTGKSTPQQSEAEAILRSIPSEVAGVGLEDLEKDFQQGEATVRQRPGYKGGAVEGVVPRNMIGIKGTATRPQDDFQNFKRDNELTGAEPSYTIDDLYEASENIAAGEINKKTGEFDRAAGEPAGLYDPEIGKTRTKHGDRRYKSNPEKTYPISYSAVDKETLPDRGKTIRNIKAGLTLTDREGVPLDRDAQQRALRDKDRAAGQQAVRDAARRRRGEYTTDELVKMARQENYRQTRAPRTGIIGVEGTASERPAPNVTGMATATPRIIVKPESMAERVNRAPSAEIAARHATMAAINQELEEAKQRSLDFSGIESLLPDKTVSSANLPEAIASEHMPGGRGTYVDRQGQMLGDDANVSGVNAPNSGQNLNAPQPQTAVDFVATQVNALGLDQVSPIKTDSEGNVIDLIEEATNEDRPKVGFYPDRVVISEQTGQLATAAQQLENRRVGRGFPFRGQGIAAAAGSVQSINALQKMSDLVKQVGLEAGANFYRFDEGGKKVKVDDPGVSDVLKYMGLSPASQSRLGLAIQAMDKAGEGPRRVSDIVGADINPSSVDNPVANTATVSQGPNITEIGRAPTKVQEIFRRGQDADARSPFIGATAEDGPSAYIKRPGNVPADMEVGRFVMEQARERATSKNPLDIGRTRVNMEKARRAESRAGDQRAVDIGRSILGSEPPAEPGMVGMMPDQRAAQLEGQIQAAARQRQSPSLTPVGNPQPPVNPVVAIVQAQPPGALVSQRSPEPSVEIPSNYYDGNVSKFDVYNKFADQGPFTRPSVASAHSGPVDVMDVAKPRSMFDIAGEVANRARKSRIGTAAGITGLGIGGGTLLNLLFGGDDE